MAALCMNVGDGVVESKQVAVMGTGVLRGSSVIGAQQNHGVGRLLDSMGAKIKTR